MGPAVTSAHDQDVENQLGELRKYVEARGWETRVFVDEGVSGPSSTAQRWMSWSGTPNAAVSMCSSAGASIGSVGA